MNITNKEWLLLQPQPAPPIVTQSRDNPTHPDWHPKSQSSKQYELVTIVVVIVEETKINRYIFAGQQPTYQQLADQIDAIIAEGIV